MDKFRRFSNYGGKGQRDEVNFCIVFFIVICMLIFFVYFVYFIYYSLLFIEIAIENKYNNLVFFTYINPDPNRTI